jgi:polyhydroxybutyrate depolymerase
MKQFLTYKHIVRGLCLLSIVAVATVTFSLHSSQTKPTSEHHNFNVPEHPIEPTQKLKENSPEPSNTIIDQPVATTGCNQMSQLPSGTSTNVLVNSNNHPRLVRVYLPENYHNATQHALVLNFHGYGSNPRLQQLTSDFSPVSNDNNFIVAYPDGSMGRIGKRGWDTGLHKGITGDDTLFVSNLLNQLQSNFCIQPTKIYATGFSNGGGFVNLLACTMADRIAAFAPVSGSYVTPSKDCQPNRPVPIIEFHGTGDEVNPYNGDTAKHEPTVTSWLHGWVQRDGCNTTPKIQKVNDSTTSYSWTSCQAQAAVVHYKIDGGQHIWPTADFKQTTNGKLVSENAATVIWQFFVKHPLVTS